MQENNIDIKTGELLKLSFINFNSELLLHEICEITNILIKSILPKGRHVVIDLDTGTIFLQRGRNNLSKISRIPFCSLRYFESYLIDANFKQVLIDKNIDYVVLINRDVFYQRFNLKREDFESLKQVLANTDFHYIDLSFSKSSNQQVDLNYSKVIYINAFILNKFKHYDEKNIDVGYFLIGSNLLYCIGEYYIDNNRELSFCLVSTINTRYKQRTIQYKKGNATFLYENKIREIYHKSRKNAYLLGFEEEDAERYALNQIALGSFSQ